jgi:D-alanyl-D-alanine carboxypeptidase
VGATVPPSTARTIGPLVEGPLPAEVAADLQEVLDDYVIEHGLAPSISAAVIVPGVGTWSGASGLADIEEAVPATPDTVYAIGSVTKPFVAALILRLAEDGYLNLDDPAATHLGPISASKSNGATVRHLLRMRSGIDSYTDHEEFWEDRPWSVAEVLELVGEPHFAPGEQFEYSNTNYLMLGLIAEVVTGGPLGQLLHEYFLDRYGLTRTYYGASETVSEPLARGYTGSSTELHHLYDGSGQLPNANVASGALGAGSMASTASEVARWAYWLYSGDVLAPESQLEMLDFTATVDYGLGVSRFVLPGTGEVIGHTSQAIPGFGFDSAAYFERDSGIVVVILANGETLDIDGALNRMFDAAGDALD